MNLSCGADVMCGKDPEDAVIEAVLCCAPIAVLGKCSPNEPLFIGIMISYYISLHIIITHNRNMYQPTSIIGWDRGICHGSNGDGSNL